MGLSTLIQISCHHVLTNEIYLNLKHCIGPKQFFNINLGIGIIKKLLFFVRIFDISLLFLLKFRSRELVGCEIKFCIQRVPTRHTFDGTLYPQNKKYLKYFSGISFLGGRGACQKYAEWVLVGCGI